MFDLTKIETLLNVPIWMKEIKDHCKHDPAILLVGTKSDLIIDKKISD